jgi:hypothetical protein
VILKRKSIWRLYADLKAYRCAPTPRRKAALYRGSTASSWLSRPRSPLTRLYANKSELLMVLDRPKSRTPRWGQQYKEF